MFTNENSIAAVLDLVHGLDIRFTEQNAVVAAVIVAQALDRFTERIDILIAEAKKPASLR